jgi:chromosomal replication initiator protein
LEDAQHIWDACTGLLREQVSDAVWLSSFLPVRPESCADGRLVLSVPSGLVRDRIESRYLPLVRTALSDSGRGDLDVAFDVRAADPGSTPAIDLVEREATGGLTTHDVGEAAPLSTDSGSDGAVLNQRYTFDAFVTGSSNQFAHAAAQRVAETPARSYNPLFIYGDAGLGKTHLLQGIGNYVLENYPTYRVRYVTSERFVNEFVDSIRRGTNDAFKRRYRDIDVLLVDDIQFLEGKEQTVEEFFHTFNHLHQANRQVVLSSDRPPDDIKNIEERLRSRFKMGLLTDIKPPELETRLAILRKKAEAEPVEVPPDVLEYIASRITDNIRGLEGALIRVSAYANLTNQPLDVDRAAQILSDLITERQPRPITPASILEAASELFGLSVDEIIGKSRRRPLVNARQVAMYVMREITDLSYPNIAREFGGRDHTTVIHAVDKIGNLMKERQQIYDQVTELNQMIKQQR